MKTDNKTPENLTITPKRSSLRSEEAEGSWMVVDAKSLDSFRYADHRLYGRVRTPVLGFPALKMIRTS